ncbi:hypothetical protein L0F63_000091 [Massospora cicadina]|nr:hypothetical protein L0F63_000091 [Massospora cicadina]
MPNQGFSHRFVVDPLRCVDEILANIDYESESSVAHRRVNEAVEAWLSNPSNIPMLSPGTFGQPEGPNIRAGSLVRFRGMAQDTSFGQEVYISRYATGQGLRFNAYRDHNPDEPSSETELESAADYRLEHTSMEDRDLWYAVSTPGLTAWAGHRQTVADNPSLRTENPKYPIPGQAHLGVILKLYGLDPNLPPAGVADLVDVVGIVGTCYTSPDLVIHVLGLRKMMDWGLDATYPWIPREMAEFPHVTYQECLQAVSDALGGDGLAAEYLLLQIVGRAPDPTLDAARFNVLNLIFPAGFDTKPLLVALENLVPILSVYTMTIASLNAESLMPRFMDDDAVGLLAGRLQLPSAAFLVVDETGMSEGQLNECGVKNIQGLTELASSARLPYIYPYFQTSLASSMSILAISAKAKALVPSQVCFQVNPLRPPAVGVSDWAALRIYLQAVTRPRAYTIPQAMADTIQANFVERRASAWAAAPEASTPTFTHRDLERQLVLARRIALALEPASPAVALTPRAWERAVGLHGACVDPKSSIGSTPDNLSKSLEQLNIDSPPPCR